jgi:FkbM family methyltransferase
MVRRALWAARRLATKLGEAGPARLDYPGADIRIGASTRWQELRRRAVAKEPWTVHWIEQFVGPGDVVYDVGANVGSYSLIAACRSQQPAQVVAVEPGYANFAALCENIIRNRVTDVITPLPVCLAARTELLEFDYRDLEAGAAIHALVERGTPPEGFEPAYRQPALAFSLDDLLARFDLPAPNHVKLDVDGSERDVLAGATQTLSAPTMRTLMIELDDREVSEVLSLLDGLDFVLKGRWRRRKGGVPVENSYGLFERREAVAA